MKVAIKQNDTNFSVLSLIDPGSDSFLNLILDAEKRSGNATSAVLELTDGDFNGYTVAIKGNGLSYGAGGVLDSGQIDSITFKNAAGKTVGSITTKEAGGLDLDIAAMQNGSLASDSVAELVETWVVTYSAKGVPKPVFPWEFLGTTFEGGVNDDVIVGSNLGDFLSGGDGNDRIDGGKGNDFLEGDETAHRLTDDPVGNDTINAGDGDDEVHAGSGNDKVYGGAGNDNLNGDDLGGTGNDKIYGEDGNDIISGGNGNDLIDGGNGQDRVRFLTQQTGDYVVTIDLARQTATGQGDDRLKSIEHASGATWHDNVLIGSKISNSLLGGERSDTIDGAAGNDRMNGNGDDDVLNGGVGNDLIAGGEESDTLIGGSGKDNFYFAETGVAHMDEITDFKAKDDQLYFAGNAAYGLVTGKIRGEEFKILENGASVDGNDRYLYDPETGILYFDRDGSGGQTRQELLQLEIGTKLAAGDIEVHHEINSLSFL